MFLPRSEELLHLGLGYMHLPIYRIRSNIVLNTMNYIAAGQITDVINALVVMLSMSKSKKE